MAHNTTGLVTGTVSPKLFRQGGRFRSSKAARGEELAEMLLGRPAYIKSLYKRILAGRAPVQEQYLLQMLYGVLPKPKDEDDEDDGVQQRFDALREQLNSLLRDHPEVARLLASATAKRSATLLPMPKQKDDDDIL